MKKLGPWLFYLYCVLCAAPYFVPALNRLEPKLFGIPFTITYVWVLVGLCCWLLYYLAKNVWDSYTPDEDGGKNNQEGGSKS